MNKKKYTIKLIKDGEEYKDEEDRNCDIFLVSDKYNRTFKIKNFIKNGNFYFELYDKNNNKIIEYKNRDFNITGVATEKEDFDNLIKILNDFKEIVEDDNISFTSKEKQQEVFYSFLARYSVQLKDNKDRNDFYSKIDEQISLLKKKGRQLVTEKIEKRLTEKTKEAKNKMEEVKDKNKKENIILKQDGLSQFQKFLKNIFPESIYNFFFSKQSNNNNSKNNLNSINKKQQKVA